MRRKKQALYKNPDLGAVQQPGKGQGVHEAVAAVQNAAVAGEDVAEVLDTGHPLHGGHGQVAELSQNGNHRRVQHQRANIVEESPKYQHDQHHGDAQAAQRTLDALTGADLGGQFAAAEAAANQIGEDVGQGADEPCQAQEEGTVGDLPIAGQTPIEAQGQDDFRRGHPGGGLLADARHQVCKEAQAQHQGGGHPPDLLRQGEQRDDDGQKQTGGVAAFIPDAVGPQNFPYRAAAQQDCNQLGHPGQVEAAQQDHGKQG